MRVMTPSSRLCSRTTNKNTKRPSNIQTNIKHKYKYGWCSKQVILVTLQWLGINYHDGNILWANGNTTIFIAKRCGQYCRRGLWRFVENEPFIQTVIKIFKFININRFWLILDMASINKKLINIFYSVRYIIYNEIIKFCMKTIRHRDMSW